MLHYHLCLYDREFDYLQESLPGVLLDYFGDQLARARAVLKERNRGEIDYAIESLDWMLEKGGDVLLDQAVKVADATGQTSVNRVRAMKQLVIVDLFDISEQSALPGATWAEYFAALSIAYLLEVLAYQRFGATADPRASDAIGDTHMEASWQRFLTHNALESMEAVCYAECLRREAAVEANVSGAHAAKAKEQFTLQSQKGGIERHADTNRALTELVAFYQQGEFDNHAEAVRQFLEQAPEELVEHLKPTNRERTLYEGLNALLKGERKLR